MFSKRFMLFPTFKKKIGVKKILKKFPEKKVQSGAKNVIR